MFADEIHRELGDEEIARRYNGSSTSFALQQADWQAYKAACTEARARHDPLPPHPTWQPEKWREWRDAQTWRELQQGS